jgi:hypothetical protein
MRVLVLESEPGAADAAVAALERNGHAVARCHDPGDLAFPCRAIDDLSRCPLNRTPIDVAVTIRGEERWTTSELEDGVACAIRARVPLVIGGAVAANPYRRWATLTMHDEDIVAACTRAASARLGEHSEVATLVLRQTLERHNAHDPDDSYARVVRRDARLRVRLHLAPAVSSRVTEIAATRVVAALRRLDPLARGIDISLGAATR